MKKSLCFLSGFLLALAVLIWAVMLPAMSTQRFEKALLSTVDQQALGMSMSDLSAFAEETMRYLKDEKPLWQPKVPFHVADAFTVHMEEVKGWVSAAPWGMGLGLMIGLALLWMGKWQRKPALLGVCALIGLIVCVLIWAAADFRSFWMVLHKLFIPGGIFAAGEPVMQLFPLNLFFAYIVPVGLSVMGHMAGLMAGIFLLTKKRTA